MRHTWMIVADASRKPMIHDLRHVKAFLTAARTGNFTRAAAELHISQSAFTVQIRQLEDALGVTLFDRSKRRVALTSAAHEVLIPLERLLIDAEAIVSRTRQIVGLRRGSVSLAVLPLVAARVVPGAMQKFRRQHPEIPVQMRDVPAERLIDAVKKEEVDFGIGTCTRVDRELRATPLMVDSLCAFVSRAHLLARREAVTLKELVIHPLILIGQGTSIREVLDEALRREKLTLAMVYETNYASTAIGMVRAGLGIAILPESAAHSEDAREISTVPITRPSLSRKIDIIQRKDRSLSPAAEQMLAVLREHAAALSS